MKLILLICILFLFEKNFSQIPNLMPLPSSYQMSNIHFRLDTSFKIEIQGEPNDRIFAEASRFFQRLSERTGLFFRTWMVKKESKLSGQGLRIKVKSNGKVELKMDESYTLKVNQEIIELYANTDIGAIRGLETLLQLLESDQKGFYFQGITVSDTPRFPWRGLLISQPYHFMTMDVIKRTLDAMSAVKMNVLHFYISDDQGYRIESKVYPRLHELASEGMYFTHEQVKEMVSYAEQRGIRIVPEIDVPGHSTAIIFAYPHLASINRNYTLQDHWGVFDPTLDPTKETTYVFLDSLLSEVSSLFPDAYFHIGGDENTGKDWQKNSTIKKFMEEKNLNSTLSLQNYFNRKVQSILRKKGKITVGWDEILMKELSTLDAKKYFQEGKYDSLIELTVPKDIVIQSWRGMEALLSSAKNGYQSILSKGYYIDLVQPAAYHYLNDPIPYNNDFIIPDSEANLNRFESEIIKKIKQGEKILNKNEELLILGGEATMWTEHVTVETFDSRVWPRTAVIAERLWSPANYRDVNDMYRRMDLLSIQLESLGLTHIKNRDMMLRRLIGTEKINSFSNFVQYLEPVQGYQRNRFNNFTRFSPYTLMVDIAAPDQVAVRIFKQIIKEFEFIKDEKKLLQIESILNQFQSDAKLIMNIDNKPTLQDFKKHAASLLAISSITLEAIQEYRSKQKSQIFWSKQKESSFKEAQKEHGYCQLMLVEPLRLFIDQLLLNKK